MQTAYADILSDRNRSGLLDQMREELPPLAAALVRARNRTGMSQYDLEEKSGVSRPTIANIETGETTDVKLSTLARLADALGITVGELADYQGGTAPMEPLVDRYLTSDYARDARPTAEEISWLRALPPITWLGKQPTEKTVDRLLEALRSGKAQGG